MFGVKAALAELLIRLRSAAVNGAVPEHVFAESVRALELGDSERERLRDELARLGLPVQRVHVHIDADSAGVEKVARIREENVFPRVREVRALLSRYADAEGYVTARAVDGVARLAGLNARETAVLHSGARLRETAVAERPEPSEDPEPPRSAGPEIVQETGDLAAAVAAARVVLDEDRFRPRPENRLLSAEAEVGLAVLVRGGPSRIAHEPEKAELSGLPPDDIRVRARDCLVLHNQRLAHSILRGYLEQGLEYDDLFQHGVLGLMTAARKFDPAKGYKFSTYATWWVRQAITRAVADEGAVIRIPVHMREQIRKVAKVERTLNGQGRPASAADVAVLCDISLSKVEEARRLSRRTDSLDRVVGDGVTLGDFVGARCPLPSVEHEVLNALAVEQVMTVLGTFSGRDHRILVRRLGLDGDEPSTLDELGREFGVTRERIRQIAGKLRPVLKQRLGMARLLGADGAGRGDGVGVEVRRGGAGGDARARRRVAMRELVRAGEESDKAGAVADADHPVPESVTALDEESSPSAALPVPDSAPAAHSSATAAAEPDSVPAESPAPGAGAEASAVEQYTCDWDEARRMAEAGPADDVIWLAQYALLAVGHLQLAVLLGQSATDAVMRAVQGAETLDRPVVAALEVLRRVFAALGESGHRPEDFFERPAEALVGTTPRAYLASKPLVNGESRLAVRDALREFIADPPCKPDGRSEDVEHAVETGHVEDTDREEADTEARLAEVRLAHAVYVEQLRREHRQQVDEERAAAAARLDAIRADTGSELDALEEALLLRMDRTLFRREQSVRAAEAATGRYREEAEARIADLETRLAQSEAMFAQRGQEIHTVRQQAQAAEQRATQRIAQTERDAWARIVELQEELAAERGIASGPTWLRDHRRQA
ncbi:sigma-70 family RNA polymerase sigma factor [Streptomyces sp. NPDC091219]|uniref:sigma-70 family RNA polymerase sigma factor n=1 Tax=Streptomyces sp. NPDC091219 TaxID=3155193 RepID=UPI00344CAD46